MFGFVAHIVADSAEGARGHPTRSALLARDISNLMLLCAKCHRLIDNEAPDDHPEGLLVLMKEEHERRVRLASGIQPDRASHVIRFGANIGKNEALVAREDIFASMLPERSPASFETIDLEMLGVSLDDSDEQYWQLQRTNLQRLFTEKIRGRIERQQVTHASVFALAPSRSRLNWGDSFAIFYLPRFINATESRRHGSGRTTVTRSIFRLGRRPRYIPRWL